MKILACDCGTSTCRASIVDGETGRRLAERSRSLPDGVFEGPEVDIERLWQVVKKILAETASSLNRTIDALVVSSFFGYVYLDGHMRPLGKATSWMDSSAEAEARTLSERLAGEAAARLIGRRLTGELLLPKLIRMAARAPERYERVKFVIGVKDELVRRLTGEPGIDFAHADYSGGYSPSSRGAVEEMWQAADISPGLLPKPVSAAHSAGRLTSRAAAEIGLPVGTPVARGTSDGSAAMYGCGVMIPGVGAYVSGTTDVLMAHVPVGSGSERTPDPLLTVNTCMVGTGTVVGGAMGYSGGAARWVAGTLGSTFADLETEAAAISTGSDGLVMVPSLTGERSPFWNPAMHGAWIGIRETHTAGHLFRSCLEGSAVRAAILLERLAARGISVSSLCVGGGGARSALWNQIRADAAGLPTMVSEDIEATIRGSALLCIPLLEGREMDERDLAERSARWLQPSRSFTPDAGARRPYRQAKRLYQKALALLPGGD